MFALFFHYLIYALTVLNKILRKSCRHMRMTSSPFLLDSAYWKRIFRRWDSSCYSCCNTFGRALLEKQLICSNVFHAIGFFMYPLKTSSFAVSFNSIKISGVKWLKGSNTYIKCMESWTWTILKPFIATKDIIDHWLLSSHIKKTQNDGNSNTQ